MELYLVRHATATEHLGGNVKEDSQRPLVNEGRKEAHTVAQALRRIGVRGDALLASPFVRTRQTAEIFAEVLGRKDKLEYLDALAPGIDSHQLFLKLAALGNVNEVLLFSHMPDLSELACKLLWAGELDIPFKKGGVCRIDIHDVPPTRPGTLKWFISPKLLDAGKH